MGRQNFGSSAWYDSAGARLPLVPSNVMMVADSWFNASRYEFIHTPKVWVFTNDLDGDGIADSYANAFIGLYNGFNPIHSDTGNILFSDGHVRAVSINAYVTNEGGLWGKDPHTRPYR